MTDEQLDALIAQMRDAISRVKPGGCLSSDAKLSAALFALYDTLPAITHLRAALATARADGMREAARTAVGEVAAHGCAEIVPFVRRAILAAIDTPAK